MIAVFAVLGVFACSTVALVAGFFVGVFACRCTCDRLEGERDDMERDRDRWRRIAQARPTFSIGAGSPWQPVDLEIERAPS